MARRGQRRPATIRRRHAIRPLGTKERFDAECILATEESQVESRHQYVEALCENKSTFNDCLMFGLSWLVLRDRRAESILQSQSI
jgi:hypothetical protein